jgi:hypothetical protein
MDSTSKNTKTVKSISKSPEPSSDNSEEIPSNSITESIEDICDENLTTLQKIHAILLNCVNLSKKQKLEFCESERYFMKLYLKKLMKENKD